MRRPYEPPAGLEDSGLAGETEIRLAVSDSVYLRRDRLPEALASLGARPGGGERGPAPDLGRDHPRGAHEFIRLVAATNRDLLKAIE